MNHVVLLGDSIFDNARYVPGGQPVVEQLREWLPKNWRATLLAVDGAVAADVPRQLERLPDDASHLVLSVGGNDALRAGGLLEDESRSAAEGFLELAKAHQEFHAAYRALLRKLLAHQLPTAVCTVYDSVPGLDKAAYSALSVFNDVILREAARTGAPVLDLRLVCTEPRDYSRISPIEPSEIGGAKIVQAIKHLVSGHDFRAGHCVVYGA